MTKSNVILVDFKNKVRIESNETLAIEPAKPQVKGKRKPAKQMNKGELHAVSLRITEIEAALDLCDPNQDDDVMLNLELELTQLDAKLSEAIGA